MVEREQVKLYSGEDSPPMDFDSDEETLLRLPRGVSPPPQHGLICHLLIITRKFS